MTPLPMQDVQCCPVCGHANQCAMELERHTGVKQPPCWCTRVDFKPEVLARIPSSAISKACVCETCATGN